ncbi:MAG TPA: PadR family transcriptional regulator [Gemmatimonas sp.]|nr:PadR family transcriptional regulator [Gemmatimonas sp.]
MSPIEFHILLALAAEPLYGYAIKEAVEAESGGALTPPAGTLYRVLARLLTAGLVRETEPRNEVPAHPGLARRYYALTAAGRTELLEETRRLKTATAMARKRLGIVPGRP